MPRKTPTTKNWEDIDKFGMMLGGFTKANNTIMREIICTLDTTAYCVYITLLSHKNHNDQFSFPSLNLVAREVGISREHVRRNINKLYNAGFIHVDSGNSTVSNKYYFPKEDFYQPLDDQWTKKSYNTKDPEQPIDDNFDF